MAVINYQKHTLGLAESIGWAARPGVRTASGLHDLLQGVRSGSIALTIIRGHRTVWTPRSLPSSLPTIVVISDDDDAVESRAPDEWRCGISAVAWSRMILIHGTGKMGPEYLAAIAAARVVGRVLIIETGSAHVMAWAAAVKPRGVSTLTLLPPPPGVHPVLVREPVA